MLTAYLLAGKQLLILLILGLIGFFLRKASVVRDSDRDCFSWLVLKVSLPALILSSILENAQPGLGKNMFFVFAGCLMITLGGLGIGWIVARCIHLPPEKRGVWLFGFMFTNGGNLGMVIFSALYSSTVLIYAAFLMFISNLLQATVGSGVMNHYGEHAGRRNSLSIIFSPPVIAGLLGLLLMALRVRLPAFCMDTLGILKSLTAPLSMFLVGAILADEKILTLIRSKPLYIYSFFRLLLLPLLFFFVLSFTGLEKNGIITLVLRAAMPCAANTAIFATQWKNDSLFASQLVALSTLFSILTIPLFVALLALGG